MNDLLLQEKDFTQLWGALQQRLQETPLNDLHEGSVARTLLEAFARELAVCYQQLDRVYQMGYLESAQGGALENVVALLGVERIQGGYFLGEVLFARSQPAPEIIPIPAGTLVAGIDRPLFETQAAAEIAQGDMQTSIPVRSVERPTEPEPLPANALVVLPRPIYGVETVSNPQEITVQRIEETDEELRERTKRVIETAPQGTRPALEEAVRRFGFEQLTVEEPPDRIGVVEISVGDEEISAEKIAEIKNDLDRVRPAGIRLHFNTAKSIYVRVAATLILTRRPTAEEQQALQQRLQKRLRDYFKKIEIKQNLNWQKVKGLLLQEEWVQEIEKSDQTPFLTPYERNQKGQYLDVSTKHRSIEGDLLIGAGERVHLDEKQLPITLTLLPPEQRVGLRVALQPEQPGDAALKAQIEATFDERFLTGLSRELPVSLSTFIKQIKERAAPEYKQKIEALFAASRFRLILIHEQDGRVVELIDPNDVDRFTHRERLALDGAATEDKGDGA